MIRRVIYILSIAPLMLLSCTTGDKQEQLTILKSEKSKIEERIEKLETELGAETTIRHREINVSTETIMPTEFKHYTEVHGTVDSDNNILVPAEVSGIIRKIYVKEGDAVERGELMAQVDDDIIRRGLEQIETKLTLATTVYERQQRLWDQQIGSEIQYLQAKANMESLEKQYASINRQLLMAKIVSPIGGTVDEIIIKESEGTAVGLGTIRVVNLSHLKVKCNLSEAYINSVDEGDIVEIKIPVLDKVIKKPITSVAKVIDSETRTFVIEIDIDENIDGLKPNMLTSVIVEDYSNESALTVPSRIIQNSGGEYFIYKAIKSEDKWIAKRTPVTVGRYYNQQCEILEGLYLGDTIIIDGVQQVADNEFINIVK